jgi:hypothetical protein
MTETLARDRGPIRSLTDVYCGLTLARDRGPIRSLTDVYCGLTLARERARMQAEEGMTALRRALVSLRSLKRFLGPPRCPDGTPYRPFGW